MITFQVKKAENCFVDAQTWEYQISCRNEQLLHQLGQLGELSCKMNLRRPIFMLCMNDGVRVKGTLTGSLMRASFPTEQWKTAKETFEQTLSALTVEGEEN
ncbi:MAG: hypothetical protein PHY23_05515 [Oscillospiraceae bacterium]|jgi:hypothetical protein|nr:hypothetical protein [Oscillospiraceae bacterium]